MIRFVFEWSKHTMQTRKCYFAVFSAFSLFLKAFFLKESEQIVSQKVENKFMSTG